MGLIPDTSVLFYLVYGNKDQRKVINDQIDLFDEIIINSTIKGEVGRNIFLDYFLVKSELLKYELKGNGDYWKNLHQYFNKRFQYKTQKLSRIISILFFFADSLNKYEQIPYETKREVSIFKIESELFDFYNRINLFTFKKDHECPQSDWVYYPKINGDGFELQIKDNCNSINCPGMDSYISEIYLETKDYINDLIEMKNSYKKKGADIDQRLVETLEKITNDKKNSQKLDYRTMYCWNMADYLIYYITLLFKTNNTIL